MTRRFLASTWPWSLRPVGESLSGAVAKAAERLKTATIAASERLMDVAEERGLNAQGLKEVAHEAAGAFGKAISGEESRVSKPDQSGPLSGIEGTDGGSEPGIRTASIAAGQDRGQSGSEAWRDRRLPVVTGGRRLLQSDLTARGRP